MRDEKAGISMLQPSPMRAYLVSLLFVLFVSVIPLQVFGQTSPKADASQVEVRNVKFSTPRLEGDTWFEAEVELNTRANGRAVAGEFVNRVKATLSIMTESTDSRAPAFYRSSVEIVALESGTSTIRFYLPPEIVKRDRLRTDIKYYVVELEAGGNLLPPSGLSVSKAFASADSVKTFQAKVAAEGKANENILMPQYYTPFANDTRRVSPTLLRRDPQR